MSPEQYDDVKRRIRTRQQCMAEDYRQLLGARDAVARLEQAIAEDKAQIEDAEQQLDSHWREVIGLPQVHA